VSRGVCADAMVVVAYVYFLPVCAFVFPCGASFLCLPFETPLSFAKNVVQESSLGGLWSERDAAGVYWQPHRSPVRSHVPTIACPYDRMSLFGVLQG
jgi:hypothetical protein